MNDRVLPGLTRRRRWLGAVIVVLVVVVAIPLLRLEPELRVTPAPALDLVIEPAVILDVDFADERHGFALWGKCTNHRQYRCERKLLATEDGTRWIAYPLAPSESAAPDRLTGRIAALGGGRVMITDVDGGSRTRFYSKSSGRTWSVVPLRPTRTVDEIPPDGLLETQCLVSMADNTECRRRRLVVTLPDTGERVWLAHPPTLVAPLPESRPADDGSWWVSGRDPLTGSWTIAVSRDAGRTWATAVLPVQPDLVMNTLSGTGSGPSHYLLATGWLTDAMEPRNLVAIFRSIDGGATWAQTWRGDGRSPRTVGGSAVVTADGGLFLAPDDVGPGYRSVDGGASFQPVLDGPRMNSVRRTRSGYLAVPSDRPPGHYLTSPDGVHWSPVVLPI